MSEPRDSSSPTEVHVHNISTHYTKDQRIFLVFFVGSCLFTTMMFTVQGPLYPPEARTKEVTSSVYGLVLATPSTVAIPCAFLATRIEKFGLKRTYALSTFISALGHVILGLMHFVDSYPIFVTFSFVALILFGIGYSVIVSAVYVLCLHAFPEGTSFAIGMTVTGFVTGTCFGALIAELIFSLVGYTLTYIIYGAVQAFFGLLICFLLPKLPEQATQSENVGFMDMMRGYGQLMKSPGIILFGLALTEVEMGKDFLATILETGVKPFHLTHAGIGIMFLSAGALQLLVPFWSMLLEKFNKADLMLVGSIFVLVVAFLFIGPVSFIPIERNYYLTLASLLLFGLGQGLFDVTAVVNFQVKVKEERPEDPAAVLFSFVAVAYSFMMGIGGLIGPAVAGILLEHIGFQNAFIFLFATHLTLGFLMVFYTIHQKCKSTETSYQRLQQP